MAAAYTLGTHSGKKSIDGKRYVQCLIPRRMIPYPCSLGGAIHLLFFAAEDPYNPADFVRQIMRSVTVLSVLVLLIHTWLLESIYSASSLYQRAFAYQVAMQFLSFGTCHDAGEEAMVVYAWFKCWWHACCVHIKYACYVHG
jgi:hypothetical protein